MAEVVGWRIVKEKHAKAAFSGEGARIFEGRWNSGGVAMVYCSEHLSLAALEILAHTQPVAIRDKFRAFRVSWDEAQGFCRWLTAKESAEGKLPSFVPSAAAMAIAPPTSTPRRWRASAPA